MKIIILLTLILTLNHFITINANATPNGCDSLMSYVISNSFNTRRSLRIYFQLFRVGYVPKAKREEFPNPLLDLDFLLPSLTPDDIWIDFGSGESYALEEYLENPLHHSPEGSAKVIGITYRINRDLSHLKNLTILKNRLFEEIPLKEIPEFTLGTDLYGIATYSPNPDVYLAKVINQLALKGTFYLQSAFSYQNVVFLPNGKRLNFVDYLNRIPGLKAAVGDSLVIQKTTENQITFPPLIPKPKTRASGSPLLRYFILGGEVPLP